MRVERPLARHVPPYLVTERPWYAKSLHRKHHLTSRAALSTLALPYFFERKDGMSEMNWPNGPDPFHYREHRNELSND